MSDTSDNNNKTEPLAKTRTRRSNAGARMHEMMFNAEDDEQLARVYGIIKGDEDSSDDEEYVPKDVEIGQLEGDDIDLDDDDDDDDGDDDDDNDDSDDSDSSADSDDDDDDSENNEDEEENDEDNDHRKNVTVKTEVSDSKRQIKRENGISESTRIKPGSPNKAAYDSCARICSVCLNDQSDEDDEIIECDSCGVTVHESCYGASNDHDDDDDDENSKHSGADEGDEASVNSVISSESTEPWFCEPCRRSVRNPHCELCPNTGGIFKQTDTGRWVHMVCALYTRGVTFENIQSLSEISLFELNYALYGSKSCTICEDRRLARSGICIGCDAGLCKTFFHPTCAQREGLLFESHSDEVDPYFAQCKQHADKSTIKKKKRTFTALFARLKRVQSTQTLSDRIKNKLQAITAQPDPHFTKWTPQNRPPIPIKVSRSLMTSPSLIIRLTKKSELLGLDPNSAFMSVQDEMEMARQKWHIPPAFNLEFVAYCLDRTTRMVAMKKSNVEIMNQNCTLKKEEASLREKYNSIKEVVAGLKQENDQLIKEARALQKLVSSATGKQFNLPLQMEQLIARCANFKSKSPSKGGSKVTTKTNATYGCGKCGTVKDQHLLSLCDTCKAYIHIYCLDPPLSRVPKKTKFGGWQCSDCSERDEEEQEEALEEQNMIAIQEADGPRKLRERIKYPEKYCHESMMLADFWSASKRRSKKGSRSSKSKRPKVKLEVDG